MQRTTTPHQDNAQVRAARPFWRRHLFKLILLPIGVLIALWFLVIMPRTSKTVDDAFPTAAPTQSSAATAKPAATTAPAAATQATVAPAQATVAPALQPTAAPAANTAAPVATSAPAPAATGPVAVKSGSLVAVAHDGSGKATIFKQADGTYILRFENLNITNGPDLRVRLLGPNGASLDLGGLKGNKGNQNYDLPAGFDPAKYDTADIWCRAFSVQFNKAALS